MSEKFQGGTFGKKGVQGKNQNENFRGRAPEPVDGSGPPDWGETSADSDL